MISSIRKTVVSLRRNTLVRYLSVDNELPKLSVDGELQKAFSGSGLSRMQAVLEAYSSIFVDGKGMESLTKLVEDGVVAMPTVSNPGSTVNAMMVYSDLRNPLLLKYGFDASGFVAGATDAAAQVKRALQSREFQNHCRGINISGSSKDKDFLRETIHPSLYFAYYTTLKGLATNENPYMSDYEVHAMHMSSVKTEIQTVDQMINEKRHVQMLHQFKEKTPYDTIMQNQIKNMYKTE
eukprot:CAMPEP_0119048382 /NCGR_PEP_ID=MMETSP1177-20130426/58580_1 /TAXON_ID=2985 /ORGANISM="Ochromonas sp, Strain CCMP1899" /LENGTH=236 /DNA_ID=CAMNT_0007024169 /DNA_START=200 /DNA_END=907 /DNA_ORIENTATION=+